MKDEPRIQAVFAEMAKAEVEALLLTHLPDIRYLCGFTGSSALLLVMRGRAVLLTDGRYTTQARVEARGVRVLITKKPFEWMGKLLAKTEVWTVSYDGSHTSVSTLARIEAGSPSPADPGARRRRFRLLRKPLVAPLRERKDAGELAILEEAARLTTRLFEETALPGFAAGRPEREVAAELEYAARRVGADGMSFETIVASGVRSSRPHGTASAAPIPERGFVTLDFGIMHKGYCSDMTRTVYIGTPTEEERDAYAAVLAAEEAGIAAVRAGAKASQVDRAARGVLRARKLGRYFTHSTGHGVGLEIHEGPRLAEKVDDVLAPGMVLTIEPGAYLPGKFGIRIEDMVAVEAQGCRILTTAPKHLITL